jgi:hypothetical protein
MVKPVNDILPSLWPERRYSIVTLRLRRTSSLLWGVLFFLVFLATTGNADCVNQIVTPLQPQELAFCGML